MKYLKSYKTKEEYINDVNYPETKDLWTSDFIADCPWEGLASAPSV